ncbi:MAG: hypothetical protein EOM19_03475 [Candidatus Moranbacteria bacterium]|nr:hypothetical protein [Candidatus Moranbacteria bacterium]
MKRSKRDFQNEDILEERCSLSLKAKLAFIIGQDRMSDHRTRQGLEAFDIAKKELFKGGCDASVAWVEWRTRLQRIAQQLRIQEK